MKKSTIYGVAGGSTLAAGAAEGACAGTLGGFSSVPLNSAFLSLASKYNAAFTSGDLSSEVCTREMFKIDLEGNLPYESSDSMNHEETGCLFVDIKKWSDKAVLAKIEWPW